jgi:hypothetical protein
MKFEGKWKYQSYRPEPGSIAADPDNEPKFVVWSPPGVATIDEGGTTGTLEFTVAAGPAPKLSLQIEVTQGSPARLSVSATMPLPGGKQFTNELHGWFVPAKLGQEVGEDNPLVVRGSIVQTSADIATPPKGPQPVLTTGFFILEPLP